MAKLLIIAATLINFEDDRGGVHHDVGDLPDVPKDTANTLVRSGRALYANKADDPTKGAINTASAEEIKAAKDLGAARAKALATESAGAAA